MRSLAQSLQSSAVTAEPLPPFRKPLHDMGVRLRRGQVLLAVGMPGAGKSWFAMDYLISAPVYGLYFAADTNVEDMAPRVGARLLDMTTEAVEDLLVEDATDVAMASEALNERVSWCWNSTPTIEDIDHEARAYEQMWGDPPDVVVVENLRNVVDDSDDEWAGMRRVLEDLSRFARASGSACIVLHHTSEAVGSPDMPQPRKAVHGKVTQAPEMVLTLAFAEEAGELRVAAVKSRNGKASPSAKEYATLYVDPARMAIYDSSADRYAGKLRSQWT